MPTHPEASLFRSYELDGAYDELFSAAGAPRDHYHRLYERLHELPPTS
ncbi:MAG TPA: hypothetical protein VD886_24175 [Herpetosiphonaceae bacterium]|nr:hypothetical protein [Herpetosiphonaceae bacterium]